MKYLYTIILDYRGGTYISQVENIDEKSALLQSIKELNLNEVQYIKEKTRKKLIEECLDEDITPIDTTKNVHIATAIPTGYLAIFHIIKTSKD